MSGRGLFWKTAIVAFWFLTPLAIFSQLPQLTLKRGIYVRKNLSCQEPPLAAIMSWDGAGFSGAHSSKCTARVEKQHGNLFVVHNTCAASGDGTPTSSAYVEEFSLTRLSAFSFRLSKGNNPPSAYRWCSAD
jgi:hypothetical protein